MTPYSFGRRMNGSNKAAIGPKPALTRRYNPGEHRPANAAATTCDTRFAATDLFAISVVLRFIDAPELCGELWMKANQRDVADL